MAKMLFPIEYERQQRRYSRVVIKIAIASLVVVSASDLNSEFLSVSHFAEYENHFETTRKRIEPQNLCMLNSQILEGAHLLEKEAWLVE